MHDRRLGAFSNYYLGLTELVLRHTSADAYMMCQDDVVFAVGLRAYLEQSLWPADDVGVVSVYCPAHVAVSRPFGFHRDERGWQSCGAHCYVFSPPAARHFLTTPAVLEHRISGPCSVSEISIPSWGGGAASQDWATSCIARAWRSTSAHFNAVSDGTQYRPPRGR